MRIYLKDLSEEERNGVEDLLGDFGISVNQVVLHKDGDKIIAEVVRTGDRYTLLFDE